LVEIASVVLIAINSGLLLLFTGYVALLSVSVLYICVCVCVGWTGLRDCTGLDAGTHIGN